MCSLLVGHTTNQFPSEYVPTVFDNYSTHIKHGNDTVNIGLWDTAGFSDYDRLRPLSYPQTDLFLLCFSVVNHESFNQLKAKWIPEVSNKEYSKNARTILIGTQIDLRDDPETIDKLSKEDKEPLLYEHGYSLSREIGAIGYLECSSKTRENFEDTFEETFKFCRHILDNVSDPTFNIHDYAIPSKFSKAKSARK